MQQMTDKQRKQLEVQKAVEAVMNQHRSKWESVPELSKKFEEFSDNLGKIESLRSAYEADLSPIRQKRSLARRDLIERVFPVASVLGVYAYDTGNRKLSKLSSVKFSELEKLGAARLMNYAKLVQEAAEKLMHAETKKGKKPPTRTISDYGLTSDHVEKLQAAREALTGSEEVFRKVKQDKRKSKTRLEKALRINKQLMKKRMDRMIQLFREDQKRFYQAYSKARIAAVRTVETKKEKAVSDQPVSKRPASRSGTKDKTVEADLADRDTKGSPQVSD